MTLTQIAVLLSVNLALIVGAMGILWLVALKVRDVSFIDGVWPLAMLFLAGVTWPRTEGDPARKWLLLGIVTLWALRLAWHLLRRWRASGADARYVAILKGYGAKGWSFGKTALLIVFLPQAVLAWLTSLPVQLGQVAATPPLGVIALTGAVLALGGLVIETVGDAQLAAFRKDPATRVTVLDTGLWRYTRHPNYFGDACVWWGLWLIAAESGAVGLWSIAGPLFLTFTLTRWSGIGITEKAISKSRPGYADYVARTSAFIPWPPRKT